jgi:pimeloyl-[acyl-carrier protein] methyl ester esterase
MNAPLVFIPGWCLGRGPLQSTVDALGGQFFDLPGYAGTPLITDFDAAADAVAATLAPGSILAGWSLGAQLALAVAARHPDKVSKLVLVAGTASFVQRDGWPFAMPPAALAEFTTAIATDAEAMLPRFVGGFNRGDAQAKEVTRQLLELADPRPSAEVLCTGLAWLAAVDLRPQLAQIQTPTLLVHGAADPLMPEGAAKALAEALPNSQVALIADCAHAPFVSQQAAFLDAVRRFLHD